MKDFTTWLALAIYRFYRFSIEMSETKDLTPAHVEEFNEFRQDVVVSTAQILSNDRDDGRSREAEHIAAFDEVLLAAGHSEDECEQARIFHQNVMHLANRTLDSLERRRGDDPPNCDPGGGVRDPRDVRDDDEP